MEQMEHEMISLFPGVDLRFLQETGQPEDCRHSADDKILEIHHCRTGRAGWTMRDGQTIYLGPGDLTIHTRLLCAGSTMSLPNGSYQGLVLSVDLEKPLPPPLADAGLSSRALYERYCPTGGYTVLPGSSRIEAIFPSFYDGPGPLRRARQQIKALELLLTLFETEPPARREPAGYSQEQIALIQSVHDRLTEDLSRRITIEALSREFCMNPSTLKALFKAVYGNSIAAHIREHRMEMAAELLRTSGGSLAEIARAVGYESQSKFSAEFRRAYGVLPSAYRKQQH